MGLWNWKHCFLEIVHSCCCNPNFGSPYLVTASSPRAMLRAVQMTAVWSISLLGHQKSTGSLVVLWIDVENDKKTTSFWETATRRNLQHCISLLNKATDINLDPFERDSYLLQILVPDKIWLMCPLSPELILITTMKQSFNVFGILMRFSGLG